MKFEYTIEDKTQDLGKDNEQAVVSAVVSEFKTFDDLRQVQLEDVKKVRDAIYKTAGTSDNEWRSQVNLPDIYELAQTMKAHLWESIYCNSEAMFDVAGRTPDAQEFAPRQKAMLVNAFDEMKVNDELDKSVNNLVEFGESVLFVGWETKTKQIRRKKSLPMKMVEGEDIQTPSTEKKAGFVVEEKVCFDGSKVRSISPENFVFDVLRKDNWDACPKIYRTYSTIEEIEANRVYDISKEAKETLEQMMKDAQLGKGNVSDGVKGNQLEILEYWGDFKLSDGTVLRNWLITVVGRQCIARFEGNPYVINPFVYANLIEDPEIKRGISPLRVALVLNSISSDILNKQLDALELISNPPYLAPKGCFTGKQEVSPGSIIEYEASLMPNAPAQLRFDSALQGWEFIQFFKNTTESSTGVFKNMTGNAENKNRTATEVNYTVGGQSTRLNMAVDNINQRIIIPMVEKVADMIANFKFGKEMVSAREKGSVAYIEVDDKVRQAEYKYVYGDRKATQERKMRYKELFEVINSFAKVGAVAQRIDWIECFKYALEQYGIENSEQFLVQSSEGEGVEPQAVGVHPMLGL